MKKLTKITLSIIGILLLLSIIVVSGLLYMAHISEGLTICSDGVGCGSSNYSEPETYDHYCSIEDKNEGVECTDEWDPVIGSDGEVHSNSCYACSIHGVEAWNYKS